MMCKKDLYGGYIDYPGKGIIYDEDVYKLILKHSRFIDRLSRSKMVEMSILGQTILMGIYEYVDPNDLSWKFYGKNSLYEKMVSKEVYVPCEETVLCYKKYCRR